MTLRFRSGKKNNFIHRINASFDAVFTLELPPLPGPVPTPTPARNQHPYRSIKDAVDDVLP